MKSFFWPDDEDDLQNELDKLANEQPGFCWHEWHHYIGFTEEYDYCIKCNKKIFRDQRLQDSL